MAVDHLAAMGLTRWVRRRNPGSATNPPSSDVSPVADAIPGFEIIAAGHEPVATALVLADPGFGLEEADPAGALLIRVLTALKIPFERFRVVRVNDLAGAKESLDTDGPAPWLAFLGEPALLAPKVIALPTLGQMLADPASKRPAWEKLRPLVGRLGS